ncbi:MAG: hypothetical protein U0166_03395 [Acidobacteriota bacterium]
MLPTYDLLTRNPDLAPVRDDPRIADVVAQCKRRHDELLDILVSARSRGEPPAFMAPALDTVLPRDRS